VGTGICLHSFEYLRAWGLVFAYSSLNVLAVVVFTKILPFFRADIFVLATERRARELKLRNSKLSMLMSLF